MHTIACMLKRILIIAAGLVLGLVLSLGAARLALAWGLFPNRELDRSSSYMREVMQLVNENYFDAKSSD